MGTPADLPARLYNARSLPAPEIRDLGKIAKRHATGVNVELARAPGYRVVDMRCWIGPRDPVRENAFPAFRVAAVVAGSFGIRSTLGSGVAAAGSLLLGNACDCYVCRHDAAGDRCINFDYEAGFLEEVRRALGPRARGERFRGVLVAPSPGSVALTAVAEAIAEGTTAEGDTLRLHEAAFEVAAAALTATHDLGEQGGRRPSLRDESRVMTTARFVQARFDRACTLAELAAEAGMSRFHFLRTFRRVLGQTPHRYVLATRLRQAALRLRATRERVVDIAAAVGFGDLSNFNASFARSFGVSPRAYRRALSR